MRNGRQHRGPRRSVIALIALLGVAAIGAGRHAHPPPLVIYNASASAPLGFYRVLPVIPIRRGDLVLARTPDSVRSLAAERGYLPATVPLVKRVAAFDGDTVCAIDHAVSIDGRHVADQLAADRLGRSLPVWTGCLQLGAGEVFLLMAGVPDSFDGRYFGPVPLSSIIGRLVPLWLR